MCTGMNISRFFLSPIVIREDLYGMLIDFAFVLHLILYSPTTHAHSWIARRVLDMLSGPF